MKRMQSFFPIIDLIRKWNVYGGNRHVKRLAVMKAYIYSQFGCNSQVWMRYFRTINSNSRILNSWKKLKYRYQDDSCSFSEILKEVSLKRSTNERSQVLVLYQFKLKILWAPQIMSDIFLFFNIRVSLYAGAENLFLSILKDANYLT